MSRLVINRGAQVLIDLGALALAFWIAFLVRFDGDVPPHMFKRLVLFLPYVVGMQYAALVLFGVRRFAWRYIGLREVTRILVAVGACSSLLLAVRVGAHLLRSHYPWVQVLLIPGGVVILDAVFAFLAIAGVRALRRLTAERAEAASRRLDAPTGAAVPTILVGAGQAGALVAREIAGRPDLGILPIGFVDDDPLKHNAEIHGIRVLGTTSRLAELCSNLGAGQVLITMANAPGAAVRRIAAICEAAGVPVKTIPGVYEIVGGKVNLSRIRPIAIEDLLGREPVVLDVEAISAIVQDRVVLVTGAGGSIGSELCRQLCRFSPKSLLLVERSENALFNIHRELLNRYPDIEFVPALADIGDRPRMQAVFAEHRPVAVFHAAAHKHVPMMEWNAGEALKNNVFGTKTLADLADTHRVEIFVQISTDKAVRPTSVMGASKRVAEMYLQVCARHSRTRFVTVRFGNVLGSAGSVVPLFREQIAAGGPVRVTHPDMRRYFMLTDEACQLVLQAASLAEGGEIFVLDMGEPVKIVDLARDMIRLSGYEPDAEIKVEFTGVRPGEKLFEELLNDGEGHDRTVHSKILVGRIPAVSKSFLDAALEELKAVQNESIDRVLPLLVRVTEQLDATASGRPPPVEPVGEPMALPRAAH